MSEAPRGQAALDAVVRGAQALCRPSRPARFREALHELRRATGADASALLGSESGQDFVNVLLVAARMISLRKRIPVDTAEEVVAF